MTSPVFGDLRGVLAQAPDARSWANLCDILERAMDLAPNETTQQWIPYASDQLSGWPDALRIAPVRWQEHAVWHALMPLARGANIYQTLPIQADVVCDAPISRLAFHQSPHMPGQPWLMPVDLVKTQHITDLTLDRLDTHLVTQMAPHLDEVTSLTLRQRVALNITPDSSSMTNQPLPSLRHFRLVHDNWTETRRATFLAASWVQHLHSLSLEQMSGTGFYGAPEDLLHAITVAAPELEHLGLPGLDMDKRAFEALSHFDRLNTVTIKSQGFMGGAHVTCQMTNAGMPGVPLSLSTGMDLRTLKHNDLSCLHTLSMHYISSRQLPGLLTLLAQSPLTDLSLNFFEALHPRDVNALARSPIIARLKNLKLRFKLPTTALMQRKLIQAISPIAALTHIAIDYTNTSSDVINRCLEAFGTQHLLHLGIHNSPCEHPQRLFEGPTYPLLQHLDLSEFSSHTLQGTDSDYFLSVEDLLDALSRTTAFPRVETLSLPWEALVNDLAILGLIHDSSMHSLRHIMPRQ